ncbi:hypothetical protein NUU61_001064 [Penicillium alfredii]|uniref:Carbohydrate kinase PfkB domain-containing protein n=1 Tax=Penicillium alfredii TaxID=1506179 RepID=A0A9W9KRA2_9EURO|nr:uncharacterized protein NUU61_001064 [Penicillium alfredii]KAJ5115305.1 hypothetical protein NUU61_001064 [Penicillium alfredii]
MAVVAIGACYVDTILTTPHYPGEDEKLRASTLTRQRGGNCPNTLEVLQQLTQHVPSYQEPLLKLVAVLPAKSSVASEQIRSGLEPRVRLSHCIYREQFSEPASSYIINSQSTGSRTIVNYHELPDMTVDEFSHIADELDPQTTLFHFEGRDPDVTLGCIQYIRKKFPHAQVSVEVEKPGRPGLEKLAEEADVVFYSKGWAQHSGYTSAEECLRKRSKLTRKATLLCCTWGQDGADAFEPGTGTLAHVGAYSAEDFRVVDTIGAGDTFIAGMLYGITCKARDWDLSTKLGFANRLAGIKVSQEGFSGLDRALTSYL